MNTLFNSKKLMIGSIFALTVLTPESTVALGIGNIQLHSGLNQKLNAEIELLTLNGENISELSVDLASPEAFDEAEIPWSSFLQNLKFTPIKRADGRFYIQVSSTESLKELFLSFIVEINWNKSFHLSR